MLMVKSESKYKNTTPVRINELHCVGPFRLPRQSLELVLVCVQAQEARASGNYLKHKLIALFDFTGLKGTCFLFQQRTQRSKRAWVWVLTAVCFLWKVI